MDFEKIYADFEAARTADDIEKISDAAIEIINLRMTNEKIPDEKFSEVLSYSSMIFFCVMKFLSDGKPDRAKSYMHTFFKFDPVLMKSFFYLLYLFGKTLYATGDYLSAMKIFGVYEKIRAAQWHDVDELSLFYRANCLALTGDFHAAIELYEKILRIKANFPEVKRDLEIVRRGSIENLAREISSLWDFPDWRDVPIFINARDRLGVMKKLIDWLLDAGYRKLIILDNRSTYPPLLEYYSALENDSRIKVIRLEKNFGYKAIWLSGILERLKISTPYVYTDPDLLPVEDCPKDFIKRFMKILDSNHELRKVGFGLVYDDITFFDSDACKKSEARFYKNSKVGDEIYHALVDTPFALYPNVRHYSVRFSVRTTGNFMAHHLPWYFDYDNLPEDEKYYMAHADKSSVTSVKNFFVS